MAKILDVVTRSNQCLEMHQRHIDYGHFEHQNGGRCVQKECFFLNVGGLLLVLRIDTGASLIQRHNAEPEYKDMPDAGFKDRCSDRLNAGRLFQVGSQW